MIFKNVTRLCAENKVTFAELERTLSFGNGTIARWKTSVPSVEKAAKVAEFFGVTVDELLKEETEMEVKT